jgi:hypothetical protein
MSLTFERSEASTIISEHPVLAKARKTARERYTPYAGSVRPEEAWDLASRGLEPPRILRRQQIPRE